MSINAIKLKMLVVQQAKTNVKTDVKEEESKQTTLPTTNKQIQADDVFKYMSATTTAPIQMKKALNVNAYVNEESASRIEDSMKNFEKQFASKLSIVKSEFGNISDDLAQKITLSMF